jgi:hypothetical protein
MQIKLIFRTETKKIKRPKDYESLVNFSARSFGNLPQAFKFFYIDHDGDLITISNQDDLDEAMDMPEVETFKIFIESSIEKVKEVISLNESNVRNSI